MNLQTIDSNWLPDIWPARRAPVASAPNEARIPLAMATLAALSLSAFDGTPASFARSTLSSRAEWKLLRASAKKAVSGVAWSLFIRLRPKGGAPSDRRQVGLQPRVRRVEERRY